MATSTYDYNLGLWRLSQRGCQPFGVCREYLCCERCGNCVLHCKCPPPELRCQAPERKKKGGSK
jgi:hypothetical protein